MQHVDYWRSIAGKVIGLNFCLSNSKQKFLGPEGGSPNATLVVLVLVVTSSLKILKAFLIHSGAQRNFAYTFVLTFPTDLPSQIFKK